MIDTNSPRRFSHPNKNESHTDLLDGIIIYKLDLRLRHKKQMNSYENYDKDKIIEIQIQIPIPIKKPISKQSSLDRRRLDYLIKLFPKYHEFKYCSDIELKEIYNKRKTRILIIDTLCSVMNLIVILAYYIEVT
jgi:hypothetical protein